MSQPRRLLFAAAAFSLGIAGSEALAQQSNDQNQQQNDNLGRPWRIRPQTRSASRQQHGAIRVVSPSTNRNTTTSVGNPVGTSIPMTPGAPSSPAPNRPTSVAALPGAASLAPPPQERRVGLGRFRTRSNLTMPQGLSVRVEGGRRVFLSWMDKSSNETSFVVQRRHAIDQGGRMVWGPIEEVSLNANEEAFADEPSEPGDYAYRVASASTAGRSWFTEWTTFSLNAAAFVEEPGQNSSPSNPQVNQPGGNAGNPVVPPTPPLPPTMPVSVETIDMGARRAHVSWDAVNGATYYQVERSPAMTSGTAIVPAEQHEFVDSAGVGTFEYRVRAVGAGGSSQYSPWISVTVSDISPASPGDFTAVSLEDAERVRLTWTDNSDNETSFRLQRSTRDGGSWTSPTAITILPNRSQQIDIPGPGEHRYRLAAIGQVGVSDPTDWVSVVVAGQTEVPGGNGVPVTPDTPGGISVSDASSQNARVGWNAVNGAAFYDIERVPAFGDGRVRVAGTQTQYIDESGAGEFQYRVRAVGAGGASDYTSWMSVTVADGVPASPSNLSAGHMGDYHRVNLAWTDNSSNETSFRVERQTEGAGGWNPVRVFVVARNATTQVDEPGPGSHRYRIAAVNSAGASSFSTWASVTVPVSPVDPNTVPPAAPGNLGASDQGRRASIMWSDASNNEQGFELERSPAFSSRVLLSTNVTGYLDNSGAGEYEYRVRAYNNAGYSDWTPWANVSVAETPPEAPSDVTADDQGDQSNVRITWGDNSFNEQLFRVERATWDNNAWSDVTTFEIAANETEATDSPGLGRYRYRVQAVNTGGDSAWSEAAVVNVTDGWTTPQPSSDTRQVYVSSSEGVDTNTGLSPNQPVRTLLRAYQLLRDNMPDHMRLKRGDVWTNEVLGPYGVHGAWDKNGRSAEEPMCVWYYGDAPQRPRLDSGQTQLVLNMMGDGLLGNIQFIGLQFIAHTRKIDNPAYIPNDGGNRPPVAVQVYGQGANFLFEDCLFDSYQGHMALSVPQEHLPEGWSLNNFVIRRSVFVDSYSTGPTAHSSGLFASNVDGLTIDECVFDHNGWSETVPDRPSNMFNHNMYLVYTCKNLVVKNTISARAAATGIQMRGQSMHSFNNLVLKCPLGITSGHAMAHWPEQGWTGSMRYNVILDSNDMGVYGDSSFAPRGFGIVFGRSIGGVIDHNIIAHNTSSRGNEPAFWCEVPGISGTISNNVVYNWTGQGQGFRGNMFRPDVPLPTAFSITDNAFQQPVSGYLIQVPQNSASPGGTWARNRYYSASSAENQWFTRGTVEGFNFASWVQRTNEAGASVSQAQYPHPDRTVQGYMASLGQQPTLEKFLEEARKQTRTNWREEYTAEAVNRWIREGFSMTEPDPALGNPPRQSGN